MFFPHNNSTFFIWHYCRSNNDSFSIILPHIHIIILLVMWHAVRQMYLLEKLSQVFISNSFPVLTFETVWVDNLVSQSTQGHVGSLDEKEKMDDWERKVNQWEECCQSEGWNIDYRQQCALCIHMYNCRNLVCTPLACKISFKTKQSVISSSWKTYC